MAYSHYERLSALDDSFLEIEDANAHMHIGAIGLFEAAPLRTADGGIDVERIRTLMEAELHRIPRYRQRLVRVPFFAHPVWVDDPRFNLTYHFGALPRFFYRRGVSLDGMDFRAMLPVNVRGEGEHLGNRVAMMVVPLPLAPATPRERLAAVITETTRVKASHQAAGMQTWGVLLVTRPCSFRQLLVDLLLIWSASEAEEWRDSIHFLPIS